MMLFVLLTLSLACFTQATMQIVYCGTPHSNYTRIESTINVASGNVTGWYYGTSWWFTKENAAYMGWQPREGIELQHLTFSAFGDGAHSDSPNCKDGADCCGGVSCWLEYPWKFGQNYTFITELVSDDGEYKWNGTLVDDVTGIETHVAYYYTPKTWGLIHQALNFDEWVRDETQCVGKSEYTQYTPVLSREGVLDQGRAYRIVSQNLTDPCSKEHGQNNYNVTKINDHAYLFQNGIFT